VLRMLLKDVYADILSQMESRSRLKVGWEEGRAN
jgi:hypothetical protein